MVKVTVFYPNGEDKIFNMDYYCDKHVPMVRQLLGAACTNVAVDQGIAGGTPGSKATYSAIGYLYFETVDDFVSSFAPHTNAIMGDLPNFTDIEPVVQISVVKI